MQDIEDGVWLCVETWGELDMLLVPFKNAWKKVIECIHDGKRGAWKGRNDQDECRR